MKTNKLIIVSKIEVVNDIILGTVKVKNSKH